MQVARVLASTSPMSITPTKSNRKALLTMTATTDAIEYRKSFWPMGLLSFCRSAGSVITTGGQATRQGGALRCQPVKMDSMTAALDELVDLLDLEPLEVDLYRGVSPN